MTEYFNITCKGERHKIEGTPCQDYSLSLSKNGITIAIVCDGHGSKPYFRSDIGARFAAEAASSCLQQFEKTFRPTLLNGKTKLCFAPANDLSKEERETIEYSIFQQLFESIHSKWKQKIHDDIATHPYSEAERHTIPNEYRNRLEQKADALWPYGTTLLAYMQTKDYWIALQIGDGIVISHNNKQWSKPIPDDKKCHDNITSSLCYNKAADDFRLYYEADGLFPDFIFLTTDGMEKVFTSVDKQALYNQRMIDVLREAGKDKLIETLSILLPEFSQLSSGDDISIACVCNRAKSNSDINTLVNY